MIKYMTRMGQKTGTLNTSKKVHPTAMTVDLETEYQNLNSGSRRMKGRNSSDTLVGRLGPSSASKNVQIISGRIELFNPKKYETLTFKFRHCRVYFWRKKSDKKVQVVNSQRICDDVPSLYR